MTCSEAAIRMGDKKSLIEVRRQRDQSWILSDLAHSWIFLIAMLANFAVRIFEISRFLPYHEDRSVKGN